VLLPDGPFISSVNPNELQILRSGGPGNLTPEPPDLSHGHRNGQGPAVRPGAGQVLTAEHGPTFDDEINLIRAGGNCGWDPSKDGSDDSDDETSR
jgi:glucose/arabinose dehydrogenase